MIIKADQFFATLELAKDKHFRCITVCDCGCDHVSILSPLEINGFKCVVCTVEKESHNSAMAIRLNEEIPEESISGCFFISNYGNKRRCYGFHTFIDKLPEL